MTCDIRHTGIQMTMKTSSKVISTQISLIIVTVRTLKAMYKKCNSKIQQLTSVTKSDSYFHHFDDKTPNN